MDYTGFLEGISCYKGKFIWRIIRYCDFRLEHDHHYIQLVFPTDKQSDHSRIRPLNSDEIEKIKNNDIAYLNISLMYERMLLFWRLDDNNICYKQERHWNKPNNHNHLRMTRILECFRLLDMRDEFEDFSKRIRYMMNHEYFKISDKTREIWGNILEEE